jgi:hypothetical protein
MILPLQFLAPNEACLIMMVRLEALSMIDVKQGALFTCLLAHKHESRPVFNHDFRFYSSRVEFTQKKIGNLAV